MLPTEKTKPKDSLSDLITLIYGPSKIGKSTFCAQAEDAIFLATEPGLNSLECYQVQVSSWKDMTETLADLAKGKHEFKTVVIDTVDNAYRFCSDHVCKDLGIKHESDLGFSKGWALVNNEFHRVLTKLSFLPYGLILISHSKEIEMEERTGKYPKVIPTLQGKAREIVLGLADIILYCSIEQATDENGKPIERRVMRTKPSRFYDAGDRTRRLPEVIDLDYQAFITAFQGGVK